MRWFRAGLFSLALATGPAHASEPWREASTRHFLIYAQDSEADLRRFAEQLERFDATMRSLQKIDDPPLASANRLTVFAVTNPLAVQRLLPPRSGDVAGFYHGAAGRSFAVTSMQSSGSKFALQPLIVLLHEYVHHFTLRNFPAPYPAWFREGFAEFFSTTQFQPDGGLTIGVPANHRVAELAFLPQPDLAPLLSGKTAGMAIYSYGWLLTHYLTFAKARDGQLNRYLAAISKGTKPEDAARDAFGDLALLGRELHAYLLRRRMMTVTLAPTAASSVAVALRTLEPDEQKVLPIALRSTAGVSKKTAPGVLKQAREAAAAFPASAAAQLALAEAAYDADQLDEADAAADKAIAADPKAVRAHLYKASVRLRRAGKAEGAARTALIKEARRSIVAANRIDPDNPQPLILYHASYEVEHAPPNAIAVAGLMSAQRFAPEDDGLRLAAARQLLRDDKGGEAKTMLAPLAYNPHGGGASLLAGRLVELIHQGGAKAALAEFESKAAEAGKSAATGSN